MTFSKMVSNCSNDLKDLHPFLLVIPVKTGTQNPQMKNPGFLLPQE